VIFFLLSLHFFPPYPSPSIHRKWNGTCKAFHVLSLCRLNSIFKRP
jgi:hypothetical protein